MKYKKKPVIIEAIQLNWKNWNEMCKFLGDIINTQNPGQKEFTYNDSCGESGPEYIHLFIPTLEGKMLAKHGDYIVKGVKGEFYPVRPDIFKETYEPV